MKRFAAITTWLVAVLHAWFFVLETVLWDTPLGHQLLKMTAAQAEATAVLAGNQGVYNAVFAVGLVWALRTGRWEVLRFFLLAIVAVGLYGAASARLNILFIQVLPAVVALAAGALAVRRVPGQFGGSPKRR